MDSRVTAETPLALVHFLCYPSFDDLSVAELYFTGITGFFLIFVHYHFISESRITGWILKLAMIIVPISF